MASTSQRSDARRRGPRRTSISDVARHAGVSLGTVSNVLNRPDRVSTATRDRVLAAIEELSFIPNGSARQLRAGTITTVGAVLLDIANHAARTAMWQGAERHYVEILWNDRRIWGATAGMIVNLSRRLAGL